MSNNSNDRKNDAKTIAKLVENIKNDLVDINRDSDREDNLIIAPLAYDGKIVNRVATVSGHMTAIKNMINEHREVEEVLDQLVAVEKSILKRKREIIKNHINSNVLDDEDLTQEEKLGYINEILNKFLK